VLVPIHYLTRSSADADNRLDAVIVQFRCFNYFKVRVRVRARSRVRVRVRVK